MTTDIAISIDQIALITAAQPFVEHYRALKVLADEHPGSVVTGEVRVKSPKGGAALFFSGDQFETLLQALDRLTNGAPYHCGSNPGNV